MLPKGYNSTAPVTFEYWEKRLKTNLRIGYSTTKGAYFLLKSKKIPEPFVVGLN